MWLALLSWKRLWNWWKLFKIQGYCRKLFGHSEISPSRPRKLRDLFFYGATHQRQWRNFRSSWKPLHYGYWRSNSIVAVSAQLGSRKYHHDRRIAFLQGFVDCTSLSLFRTHSIFSSQSARARKKMIGSDDTLACSKNMMCCSMNSKLCQRYFFFSFRHVWRRFCFACLLLAFSQNPKNRVNTALSTLTKLNLLYTLGIPGSTHFKPIRWTSWRNYASHSRNSNFVNLFIVWTTALKKAEKLCSRTEKKLEISVQ